MNSPSVSGPVLRGLIMDWGGVLTASLDGAMAAWARRDAIEYEHFREVMGSWVWSVPTVRDHSAGEAASGDPGEEFDEAAGPVAGLEEAADGGPSGLSPVHRLERGEIDGLEFERELADALARRGSVVDPAGLLDRMLAGLQSLDGAMVGLIRRAKARGIRTALLSNSWGEHYPEQLWNGLFDAVVISGRVGLRKPEPAIFRHACDQLELAPAECVMVDDLPHNVRAAVAVGLVAVHHRTFAETAGELEILFDVSLRRRNDR